MTKGFKDSNGKFRTTGKKNGISSNATVSSENNKPFFIQNGKIEREYYDYTKEELDSLSFYVDRNEAMRFLQLRDLFHNALVSMKVDNAGKVVNDTMDEAVKLVNTYKHETT